MIRLAVHGDEIRLPLSQVEMEWKASFPNLHTFTEAQKLACSDSDLAQSINSFIAKMVKEGNNERGEIVIEQFNTTVLNFFSILLRIAIRSFRGRRRYTG
jgi:hypothetical protein